MTHIKFTATKSQGDAIVSLSIDEHFDYDAIVHIRGEFELAASCLVLGDVDYTLASITLKHLHVKNVENDGLLCSLQERFEELVESYGLVESGPNAYTMLESIVCLDGIAITFVLPMARDERQFATLVIEHHTQGASAAKLFRDLECVRLTFQAFATKTRGHRSSLPSVAVGRAFMSRSAHASDKHVQGMLQHFCNMFASDWVEATVEPVAFESNQRAPSPFDLTAQERLAPSKDDIEEATESESPRTPPQPIRPFALKSDRRELENDGVTPRAEQNVRVFKISRGM